MYYDYADLNYINEELSGIWPGWTAVKLLGRGAFGAVYEIHRGETSGRSASDAVEDRSTATRPKTADLFEKSALKVLRIPEDDIEIVQLRAQGVSREKTEAFYEKYIVDVEDEIFIMQKLVGNSHLVSYEDYSIRKREEEIGWDVYIRMELLTGLPEYMKNNLLTEQKVLKLGMDISQGLRDCHQKGIIHRDIKPQNIFVNEAGDFKLGDFGVSRDVLGGMGELSFKGTLAYMAPEVYKMVSTDERSDIYSLGMVLYQCLNDSRLPFVPEQFTSEDLEASRHRRFNGEQILAPAHGSESIKRVVLTAISPDPKDRYQTADEMYHALLDVSRGKTPLPPTNRPDDPYTRRNQYDQPDSYYQGGQPDPYNQGDRTDSYNHSDHPAQNSGHSRLIILAGVMAAAIVAVVAGAMLFRTFRTGTANNQFAQVLPDAVSEEGATGLTGEQTAQADTGTTEEQLGEVIAAAEDIAAESIESQPSDAASVNGETTEPEEDFEDYEIQWTDRVLERGIRDAIDKHNGKVMYSDVKDLNLLHLEADPFRESTKISDISNLRSMPKLEHLYLEYNNISDISVLSELTNLRDLWICENKITDITPLLEIPNLQILNIGGNPIDDYSPLREITTLRKLCWEKSNLRDCSYIVDMVRDMPDLKSLVIGLNYLTNKSALTELSNLEELWISESNTTDISFLSGLPNLKILNLAKNNISDISVLRNLPDLNVLDLSDNKVSNISALSDLENLRFLNLQNNPVSDFSPLDNLNIVDLKK